MDNEQIAKALDDLANSIQKANEQIEEKPVTPEWAQPRTYEWEEQQLREQTQAQNEMAAEANKAWNNLMNDPRVQAFRQARDEKEKEPHVHGPFTFLLNANHNALRGCQSCGVAWVGFMAGSEDDLRWHYVEEVPEEE